MESGIHLSLYPSQPELHQADIVRGMLNNEHLAQALKGLVILIHSTSLRTRSTEDPA
jgi:hypothetical protein